MPNHNFDVPFHPPTRILAIDGPGPYPVIAITDNTLATYALDDPRLVNDYAKFWARAPHPNINFWARDGSTGRAYWYTSRPYPEYHYNEWHHPIDGDLYPDPDYPQFPLVPWQNSLIERSPE